MTWSLVRRSPQFLDKIARTWKEVYARSAKRVVGPYKPRIELPPSPLMDQWVVQWAKQSILLLMQPRTRPEARQSRDVWWAFGWLYRPKWDLDFIPRVLWRKWPLRVRMEWIGGKLCPLYGRVEDHSHALKNCYFSVVMFDTVRKAFGLVREGDRCVEPSRLLLNESLL